MGDDGDGEVWVMVLSAHTGGRGRGYGISPCLCSTGRWSSCYLRHKQRGHIISRTAAVNQELTCRIPDKDISGFVSVEVGKAREFTASLAQSDVAGDTGELEGHDTLAQKHGETQQSAPE